MILLPEGILDNRSENLKQYFPESSKSASIGGATSSPAAAPMETTNNRTVKACVFFFDGYHMRNSDGVYTGYGIELLNLISQYSHLNFEFTGYDKSWEEMQSILINGEIDMVTSARKTKQRTEVFAFSLPIERNNTVLSIQKQNTSIISGNHSTYAGCVDDPVYPYGNCFKSSAYIRKTK